MTSPRGTFRLFVRLTAPRALHIILALGDVQPPLLRHAERLPGAVSARSSAPGMPRAHSLPCPLASSLLAHSSDRSALPPDAIFALNGDTS